MGVVLSVAAARVSRSGEELLDPPLDAVLRRGGVESQIAEHEKGL